MKILYTHFGRKGKDGWGRTFYLAKALANNGHDVTLLTCRVNKHLLIKKEVINKVTVISFPDIIPSKLYSTGFGILSVFLKLIYSLTHKFDLTITDCGHRPSSLPSKLNRVFYKTTYFTEWWDFFGAGGYYDNKPLLFKLLYGNFEKNLEVKDKLKADGVIVLSEQMKNRALENGVKRVEIIHGGSAVHEIYPTEPMSKRSSKLNICYIGIDNLELFELTPFLEAITNEELNKKVKFITFGSKLSNEYISKYNLSTVLEERGWINYLTDISKLNDVDLFVQIRRDNAISRAGWPNKLGDYLATGKPIMIFPYGDLKKFVSDHREGFVVVDYNKESIMFEINKILSNTYDLEQMGRKNRATALENSWEKKAEMIINFYNTVQNDK